MCVGWEGGGGGGGGAHMIPEEAVAKDQAQLSAPLLHNAVPAGAQDRMEWSENPIRPSSGRNPARHPGTRSAQCCTATRTFPTCLTARIMAVPSLRKEQELLMAMPFTCIDTCMQELQQTI